MPDETTTVVETEVQTPAATPATPAEPLEETVTMPRQEADALRRKLAEAERNSRKLEADQRKAEEKRQEEEGQHKQLSEQRGRELEQERGERARVERDARISRLAARLKFLDPQDVIGRVTADEGADDASAEAALSRIAEASPHLIQKDPPARPEIGQVHTPSAPVQGQPGNTQPPQPPPGKAPLQSLEEADQLSVPEAQERMAEIDWLIAHQK